MTATVTRTLAIVAILTVAGVVVVLLALLDYHEDEDP